ncbi:MAG: hypothetical protein H0V66_02380, partial [Bdellovibrionales bacterium]|nr:hypothetical protein [Bdellovibrionales bacterium]
RALTPPQQEQQIAPAPEEFRTRLNNNLLVEGVRCRGNETTEPGGHGSLCSAGQYLIFIDHVNTCDTAGRCSGLVVTPLIGELLDINAGTDGFTVFDIDPISPVSDFQRNVLESISIRADVNGNGTVFLDDTN